MKKRAINILAVFVCLAALAGIGRASSAFRLEISIPFDFVLKNQTLPAGDYSFERLSADDSSLFVVRSDGDRAAIIFRVQPSPLGEPAAQTQLVFERAGADFELSEIRVARSRFSLRLLRESSERR